MKSFLAAFLLVSSLSVFAAESELNIAGTYTVTNEMQPGVTLIVTLTADGKITLIEKELRLGQLKCEGTYAVDTQIVDETILRSAVTCENGLSFMQSVDLTNVENLARFTAPTQSTLFGAGVKFKSTFEKIQ